MRTTTAAISGVSTNCRADDILFTDAKGQVHPFRVVDVEQYPGTAVEDVTFGNADEWDLTLFTCTLDGQSRVTVRAEKTENL